MKKYFLSMMLMSFFTLNAYAHGPSPQKVIKEFTIKANQDKVWALLKDFGAIDQWHPDVASVKAETKNDPETSTALPHRIVVLKSGLGFEEKLREVNEESKKMDYKMIEGENSTIAVSNYRTVIQLKAGANANETIVTMTGRFYNQANSMEAVAGKDNPAANKAINSFYDAAEIGLKKALE